MRYHRPRLISLLLIGGTLSFAACATKLPPKALDGRECVQGVVGPLSLEAVRLWAPQARVGDRLITADCDRQQGEDTLNDVRLLFR